VRSRSWLVLLQLAGIAAAVHVVAPETVQLVAYESLLLAVVVATTRRWWRSARGTRATSGFLALTFNALFVTEIAVAVYVEVHGHEPKVPSLFDIGLLAPYVAAGAALALAARARTERRDWTTIVDASIITIGASVVFWQFLIAPNANLAGLSALGRVVQVMYPSADLVLFAFAIRLAVGPGMRSMALRLLIGGILLQIAADCLFTLDELGTKLGPLGHPEPLWMVSFGMVAAAVLHPSWPALTDPRTPVTTGMRWGRLSLLTAATLLAPTVGLVAGRADTIVPTLGSAVLFVLVMTRVGGLLRQIERSNERRFRSLVQHASDFLIVVEPSGRASYASPATTRSLGVATGDTPESVIGAVHPDARTRVVAAFDSVRSSSPDAVVTVDAPLRFTDGSWRTVALQLTNLIEDHDVRGVVVNAHDIHELRALAYTDPLSGLANRTQFRRTLDETVATGGPMAVLLLDLDGFKEINDSLGHAAGDRVLREVGQRLTRIAHSHHLVARLGGDEFAVLMPKLHHAAEPQQLARFVIGELLDPIDLDGLPVHISTSVGVRVADATDSADDVMRDADIAMYAAKRQGRGQSVLFERWMLDTVLQRAELRSALDEAISGGQLLLHYQPQFHLDDGALEGFEALVRWHHPVRGFISPADFIPAAEESGQVLELGRWVLHEAATQLRTWTDRFGPTPLTIAVNASPRQLVDPRFAGDVAAILAAADVRASAICLEITETALVDQPDAVTRTLDQLKELGIRLAIDDYGAGNASIQYLRRFPVDTLKIDRSLTDALFADHGESRAIVSSISELAGILGLATCVEGIETAEQLDAVVRIGCQVGQGYYLGRPLPVDRATEFLAERIAGVRAPVDMTRGG
jgi:diguanylate cyclase (GGDEF)-like protein/PAS domain S-box-containing protein